MSKLQFKKIELYGTDLSQFDKQRCPLNSTVHVLTVNQTVAITFLVNQFLKCDINQWLLSVEEAEDLKVKLKNFIAYEKC
jgi:hypothetical protein